ncbi:Fc.00g029790.m01.CDS01 [Cosmosporella sp. VM-42]
MISVPRLPQHHSTSSQQHHYTPDCHTEYPFEYSSYSPSPTDLSRSNLDDSIAVFNSQPSLDLMQSDAWGGALAQFTPRLGRYSHQRDSSLSSLGSAAGSASPYTHHTSNPQIAVTDAAHDSLLDHNHSNGQSNGHSNSYYQLAKSISGPYQGYGGLDNAMPDMAYPVTIPGPRSKPRIDRGLLPAPDFPNGSNRSHPASVASSIAGDSPATPTVGEPDYMNRRRQGTTSALNHSINQGSPFTPLGYGNVPKLDRTMTDVYNDELYSPNFAITSTSPAQPHMAVSPTNDVFSQRLQAANSQHLSAAHSPASSVSRDRSPFRTGSPLAPSPSHDFGTMGPNVHFNTAQRIREQNKAQQDAQLLHGQMAQRPEPETPKTISPKDSILEFNEPEGEPNFPLFPQDSSFEVDQFSKGMASQGGHDTCSQQPPQHDGASNQFSYLPSHMPGSISVPQQYPFIAHPRLSHETPPRLSSAGSSSADSGNTTPAHNMRPMGTTAEGGTYTCTYHGCTMRFETPSLLQKHKREGHRQTQALNGPRAGTVLGSQAGPHRCNRINPSTGKQCNTVFSRPYDLTRHEDTIHNARKQKVRCNLCTEEKTFSRADALTRHYRVCHPDMQLPGKHRRRGGS